jgi:voltage-dependent calcium channel T type alpha-1G
MILKIIAEGFYVGKNAYLKNGWNIIDFLLVIISIIDVVISLRAKSSHKILRLLRILRTLRPLRVINRNHGLKLVVTTLLKSIRPIGNIILISCTFFFIFGILGIQVKIFFFCCFNKIYLILYFIKLI